ncbi:MAG: damage-control phosphatase ARMT1 family protein [Chloroflexota bacterium]
MKLAPDCYECLRRLLYQAADLATDDVSLKQRATKEAKKILDNEFSYSQLSIVIATKIHKIVREVTNNPDPYRAMKEREMTLARKLYPEMSLRAKRSNLHKDDLRGCLKLAAAANAIDFFGEPRSIKDNIRKPVRFAIDDSEQFQAKLKDVGKLLYLADNAGELYFDLPLVKWMKQFAQVIYVVKPSPVQDDLTREDVMKSGLEGEFGKVMSTGIASPGIIFSSASAQFKQEFESADLIFAKGMGHYEALSEISPEGKFFYCLKAKCQPVADSLGVPVNSYVAMLQ